MKFVIRYLYFINLRQNKKIALTTQLLQQISPFVLTITLKINLVLPLGIKVVNVKNLHSKNHNRKFNIIQLIDFCNYRIPTSNFIFVISFLCKKRLNHTFLLFLFPSLLSRIQQLHAKVSIRKNVCINDLYYMNELKQPFKKVFCKNRYFSKQLFYRVSS